MKSTAAGILTIVFAFAWTGVPAQSQAIIQVPAQHAGIQAAINAALPGDTIEVAPGVWTGTIDFKGKDVVVRSTGGPAVTTLDGAAGGSVVTFAMSETRAAVLEGFTIRNGTGNPPGTVSRGGGIYISTAPSTPLTEPTIRSCIIEQNSARFGAGVYALGSPLFEDCIIRYNVATNISLGGGVFVTGESWAEFHRCIIEGHLATNGGAFASVATVGTVEFASCLITGNTAAPAGASSVPRGGAVFLGNLGAALFRNCTVTDNTSPCSTTQCSSIFETDGGRIDILNSIVWNNAGGGPTLTATAGFVQIADSVFEGTSVATLQTQSGVLTADPEFADPENGDYSLLPPSPCRDSGSAIHLDPADLTDLNGAPRVSGSAVDMGALELPPFLSSPSAAGRIEDGIGGVVDVLLVNSASGGAARSVQVGIGQLFFVQVLQPPLTSGPADFAVFGMIGAADYDSWTNVPLGIGGMGVPPCPMFPWAQSVLFTLTYSTGLSPCPQIMSATPTPWFSGPVAGIPFPVTFTLQAVVETAPGDLRPGNLVIVEIQ